MQHNQGSPTHQGVNSRTVCRVFPSSSCQDTARLILPDPWESSSPELALSMLFAELVDRNGGTASFANPLISSASPLFASLAPILASAAVELLCGSIPVKLP